MSKSAFARYLPSRRVAIIAVAWCLMMAITIIFLQRTAGPGEADVREALLLENEVSNQILASLYGEEAVRAMGSTIERVDLGSCKKLDRDQFLCDVSITRRSLGELASAEERITFKVNQGTWEAVRTPREHRS